MKNFVILFFLFTVLTAVVHGARRCDYKCTKSDGNVCANNGKCIHLFPSHCQMEKYNCLFPQKAFRKIETWKCNENSMPLCAVSDL
ncbi:uncharacterized protein LOC129943016 [Eupeodes corollae]|uniref:uncharacterized protein LOC129943016 n=1 Tax=Eupeodes corollae TaxID=290404 RepID=UPI002490EB15|nr:uncharacterized protein LOC129943016 [Eupeodes corollae]